MPDRYLALWLEAPLQSWGSDSRFYRRDTLNFPTRSGILGLLCCAKGAGGEQTEWLAMMQDHGQTVYSYRKPVSIDHGNSQCGLLQDFHMVGSGYDEADPWQSLLIPKTSERKKPVGAGTKITYRYYLQDSVFGVVIDMPEDEALIVAEALQVPVWDLYLGRKCCVPTELIYRGTFTTHEQARSVLDKLAADKGLALGFEVIEGDHSEIEGGEVVKLNDVPIRFGSHKLYRDRNVTVIPVSEEESGE